MVMEHMKSKFYVGLQNGGKIMISRQNALFTGRGSETMSDRMDKREQEIFTPMERLVMEHLRKYDDGFIAVNESGLYEQDIKELFTAIYSLEEKRIIRKRDCEAIAYEWDDKTVLLKMLH